ncbi:MAG: ABC transporter permease [Halolamina sp.]|uniref:ABC transporter permease n=1 Tax=Halolamina sp. TaxID=1940283 RepID=UPI002FC3BC97
MTTARPTSAEAAPAVSERLRQTPWPAAVWAAVAAGLLALQLGALFEFGGSIAVDTVRAFNGIEALPGRVGVETLLGFEQAAAEFPRLLSRETIPNHGYYSGESEEWVVGPVYYDGQEWVGTFLGLQPAVAWALRVVVVYAYAFAGVAWLWTGYNWYRRDYRVADWTPTDDVVDRLRSHYWGLFGLLVVLLFLTTVLFGPALATTTNQVDNVDPYSYEINYWDAEAESVETTTVGSANSQSSSTGSTNVGPMSYDDYGRFHPFGTLPGGQDLFTFIMYGARLSLIIGLITVGLTTGIAVTLAMVSAYYKGRVDLALVLLSDSIMALPGLLVIIMLSVLLGGTWLANIYSGGLLLSLIFVATGWPGLWRAIRGPTLQTVEREWVDAARGFGLRPSTIMRKHVLPYVMGYLLVYGSMSLGGVIIGIAGLSYLGLGVNPPTPEWGRAIGAGQPYIGTPSWHISIVPGVLITTVVIGFNALGDGIRDAIDPQSDTDAADTGGVERGGGA